MNVKVTLIETAERNIFAKAFADALVAKREELKQAASSLVTGPPSATASDFSSGVIRPYRLL